MNSFDIIKNVNECSYTGLETVTNTIDLSYWKANMTLNHFTDNNGYNRFVIKLDDTPIAAIMFDESNTCMFRETTTDFRLQGMQSNLWLFAASVLGNIFHSEDLTEDGRALIK